jgi:hypothetical protein
VPCNETWIAAGGREIKYHDLEGRHLANIIRMLERQIMEAKAPPYGSQWDLEEFDGIVEGKRDQLQGLREEQQRRMNEDKDTSREEELQREREASLARISKQTEEFKRRNRRR